jgi:hypothetical protein
MFLSASIADFITVHVSDVGHAIAHRAVFEVACILEDGRLSLSLDLFAGFFSPVINDMPLASGFVGVWPF